MSSYYRQQLESWLKDTDVKALTVYDVGGKQNPVKGRTKSWDVKHYEILDLPKFDLGRENEYFDVDGVCDVLFCLEVFEYLIDPVIALENISELLKTGGKAYVTFAFAYPHHEELELDSLRYTEFGIRRMAERVGLIIDYIWYRRDKSGLLKSFYATDGMHPARKYSEHDVTGFIVEFTK